MPSPDVIVVGAGLVGALCAVELAAAGARVTLIEAAFAGGGSTGAAMGHLVVMDDTTAQRDLCAWSRGRWNELLASLPDDAEHDRCGTLWLAANDTELGVASRRAHEYRLAGVAADVIDSRQLELLEPALAHGLAGALLVPGDGVCYPPAIARALVCRATEAGVVLLSGMAVRSVGSSQVLLADGTRLTASAIVIAAGVESKTLVPDLPLVPRKGHLVITDRHPGMIRHQLVELGYLRSAHALDGASVAFNVQPRRTGQLLIGSSRELAGFDVSVNHSIIRDMLARAMRFVPRIGATRAWRSWVGFRPATPDALPLIGPWPAMPGVWIATGHEGLGITMAPGTANIIVAGILGRRPAVSPDAFLPHRAFPNRHPVFGIL